MVKGSSIIANRNGIHVRPSRIISDEAASFSSTVTLHANETTVGGLHMMNLLCLGLKQGDQVDIEAEGPDEQQALCRLKELFETHFDFPPEEETEDDHS